MILGVLRAVLVPLALAGPISAKQTIILRGAIDEKDAKEDRYYVDLHRIPVVVDDGVCGMESRSRDRDQDNSAGPPAPAPRD